MGDTEGDSTMLVLSALPPSMLSKVRIALGRDHVVRPLDLTRLAHPPESREADAVIVATSLLHSFKMTHEVVRGVGPRRLVAYSTVEPAALKTAAELVRAGVHHLVVAGVNDSRDMLRTLVCEVPGDALAERFCAQLSEQLSRLPSRLCNALIDVLQRPRFYLSVAMTCAAADTSRRSCDRQVQGVGISSIRRLLAASRVVHAVPQMRHGRLKLNAVAQSVGVPSDRQLAAHIRRIVGVGVRSLDGVGDAAILVRALAFVHGAAVAAGR